jgi:hypothetical protein
MQSLSNSYIYLQYAAPVHFSIRSLNDTAYSSRKHVLLLSQYIQCLQPNLPYFVISFGVAANVGLTNLRSNNISFCSALECSPEDIPVTVISTRLASKKLLFSCFVGEVPSHKITIFFCLEDGNEVDARPHLFACELAAIGHC